MGTCKGTQFRIGNSLGVIEQCTYLVSKGGQPYIGVKKRGPLFDMVRVVTFRKNTGTNPKVDPPQLSDGENKACPL